MSQMASDAPSGAAHWSEKAALDRAALKDAQRHAGDDTQQQQQQQQQEEYQLIDPQWEGWASHHGIHHTLRGASGVTEYLCYLSRDCQRLKASVTFGSAACGAPGLVHPGVLNMLLDDSLGALFLLCKQGTGFTANLRVSHGPSPLPVGRQASITAEVESVEPSRSNPLSRKIYITGRVTSVEPGRWRTVTHATARLLFIARMPTGLIPTLVTSLPAKHSWTLFALYGHVKTSVLPALCCGGRRGGKGGARAPTATLPTSVSYGRLALEPVEAATALASRASSSTSLAGQGGAGAGESSSNSSDEPSAVPTPTPTADASGLFHLSDLPDPAEVAHRMKAEAVAATAQAAPDKGAPLHLRHAQHVFSPSSGALSWHPEGVVHGDMHVLDDGQGEGAEGHPHMMLPVYVGTQTCGHVGIVHGGLLAALLQDAGSALAWARAEGSLSPSHALISVDYRKPCMAGRQYVIHGDLLTTGADGEAVTVKLRLLAADKPAKGKSKGGQEGGEAAPTRTPAVHCEATLSIPRRMRSVESFEGLAAWPSDPRLPGGTA